MPRPNLGSARSGHSDASQGSQASHGSQRKPAAAGHSRIDAVSEAFRLTILSRLRDLELLVLQGGMGVEPMSKDVQEQQNQLNTWMDSTWQCTIGAAARYGGRCTAKPVQLPNLRLDGGRPVPLQSGIGGIPDDEGSLASPKLPPPPPPEEKPGSAVSVTELNGQIVDHSGFISSAASSMVSGLGDENLLHAHTLESPGGYTPSMSSKRRTKLKEILDNIPTAEAVMEPTTGRFRMRIMRDKNFQLFCLDLVAGVLICLNAVQIGVSSDFMRTWTGWNTVDSLFAVCFTIELALKLRIVGLTVFFCGEERRWNLFELFSVTMAMAEVATVVLRSAETTETAEGNLSLLRVLRLMRVTRLIRLARLDLFTDLMMLLKGALGGFRTLFWAGVLIALPLYVFAILFRETLGVHEEEMNGAEYFRTVAESFFTLYRCTVSSECTDTSGRPIFALVASSHGWAYSAAFCCVEVFMIFGLFNVIVAIFIENVLAGAKTNGQIIKRQRLRDKKFFASKMTELIRVILIVYNESLNTETETYDLPGTTEELVQLAADVVITPAILEEVRQHPGVLDILGELAIDDEDSYNLFETLDVDGSGSIDIEELFEGIARLRGDARRSDLVALSLQMQRLQVEVVNFHMVMVGTCNRLEEKINEANRRKALGDTMGIRVTTPHTPHIPTEPAE